MKREMKKFNSGIKLTTRSGLDNFRGHRAQSHYIDNMPNHNTYINYITTLTNRVA